MKNFVFTVRAFVQILPLWIVLKTMVATVAAQPAADQSLPPSYWRSVSPQEVVKKYTTAQKRFLAINTAIFINTITQSHLDADSVQLARKNDFLQHLLTEKEWLLKEVHHRVKNNLHTVICLLESQARYLENDALEAIETSQHRIYAMSLIHQKLYQSDDIKSIDMATYIPELAKSLKDGFGVSNRILFKLDIQPISLSLSHAIPLALIINEAVTNSIKYAFPDNRNGVINITMADDGIQTMLEIADNGIGMPKMDHDIEPESLGIRLIKELSEDIEAETIFSADSGTRITISFRPDPLNDPDKLLGSSKITEDWYA